MHEVETINILNQHFKGRYFRHLANLADSFFTSFYKRQIEDPECHALDEACEKYPEFGLHFSKDAAFCPERTPCALNEYFVWIFWFLT